MTLMGDTSGKPILMMANSSIYTFNAEVEKALFNAGLYLISICAPGCGRTDSAPQGEARMDYLARDTAAVMDHLGIPYCVMMAYHATAPMSYIVANKLEGRITHMSHIAANAPMRYFAAEDTTQSSWVNGIIKAGTKHPGLQRILFKGAMKAWATIGAKQFMRLQMGSNSFDSKWVLAPENIRESDHALKMATLGGLSGAAEDIAFQFEDWNDEVEQLLPNITVVHGTEDTLYNIDYLRRFAAAYPEKIKMFEIQYAGLPLLQSHTHEVIRHLKEAVQIGKPHVSRELLDSGIPFRANISDEAPRH